MRDTFARDVAEHFKEQLTQQEYEPLVSYLCEEGSFATGITAAVRKILSHAKNLGDDDAIMKAIEFGEQSSKCILPLRKSIESVLVDRLGKQIDMMSGLFERSPFLTKKSMDECRRIVVSAGHAMWLTELAKLKKQLASNEKLKSVAGS